MVSRQFPTATMKSAVLLVLIPALGSAEAAPLLRREFAPGKIAVIDKRVRWFAGWSELETTATQEFMLSNHSNIVDGLYAFGGGAVLPNGSLTAWRKNKDYSSISEPLTKLRVAGKEVLFSIAGGALPRAAFDRRREFAQEVLSAVLDVNATGVTLDFEGTCDNTSATLAQWAATWDAVAQALHSKGRTLGMCINDGLPYSTTPDITKPNGAQRYGADWAYPMVIPFMDFITDMTSYPLPWLGAPAANELTIRPCDPAMHFLGKWCNIEGLIQNQIDNGVDTSSGQLSPGIWLNACTDGQKTKTGWTQPTLHAYLEFLDQKGVRALDVWTDKPDPAAPTCGWVYTELAQWRGRP